ncbi:MAG: DUF3052 domain-containing protein [Phenylobacterium sp.]
MGKEATVTATFAEGAEQGRLQYEPPKLIFRGAERRVFEGEALKGVRADGADLVLADGTRFALGERQAKGWADAILKPKGRMEKIGVKPGMRAAVMGVADPTLSGELAEAGAVPASELAELDLLFYAADSEAELARVAGLLPLLSERGALWIVSRKGKAATVKDTDVMAAAKAHGLVDNKVVAFSGTHTSLRFVRRQPG